MKIFKRRDIRPIGGRDLDEIEQEERLYSTSVWKTAGVMAASVVLVFAVTAIVVSREPKPPLTNDRIVIVPLENRTGDPKLDALGDLAADWATQRLIQARQFEVVPYTSVTEYIAIVPPSPSAAASSRALQLARSVGAGLVIWGAYYYEGDSLRFSAEITDASTGELVRSPLTRQLEAHIGRWALNNPATPALAAHAIYSQALRFYARSNYETAAQTFHEAWQADTTFGGALVWEARSLVDARAFDRAGALLAYIEPRRPRLTIYERAQLDHIAGLAGYNPDLSYGASQTLTQLVPASDEAARYLAVDALALNHPRETRTVLTALNPDHGAMRGWPGYYTNLAMALHLLGNYREELRIARSGAKKFPRDPEIALAECRAHAALKNGEAALLVIAESDLGSPRVRCAGELYAHGELKAANNVASRAVFLYQTRRTSFADRLDHSIALMMLYQNERAYKVMQQMVGSDMPDDLRSVARFRLAVAAAKAGHRDDAIEREVRALEEMDDTPYVTLERARLAVAQGNRAEALRLFAEAINTGLPYAESQRALPHAEYLLRIK